MVHLTVRLSLRGLPNRHDSNHLLTKHVTLLSFYITDHDYGCNNADSSYEFRYESGIEFVHTFLGQPEDSPMGRRALDGKGVYGVKVFDFARPPGMQEVPDEEANIDPDLFHSNNSTTAFSSKSVAVFVLDVRSNKSPWKQGREAFMPDYEGDFLGEDQWQWFETALANSKAAVNVVVSGLQHHANLYPDPNVAEAWDKFPRAQQRLFDALLQDKVQAPILISGDVHMAQLMRKDCERVTDVVDHGHNAPRRPRQNRRRRSLVEMTTSGMTHSWGAPPGPPLSDPNRRPSMRQRLESILSRMTMEVMLNYVNSSSNLLLVSNAIPWSWGGAKRGASTPSGLQYSLEKNFGELEFDWEERTVTMRALGEQPGAPALVEAHFSMDQLSGNTRHVVPGSSQLTSSDFLQEANRRSPRRLEHGRDEWICLDYRRESTTSGWSAAAASATMLLSSRMMIMVCCTLALIRLRKRSSSGTGTSCAKPIQ